MAESIYVFGFVGLWWVGIALGLILFAMEGEWRGYLRALVCLRAALAVSPLAGLLGLLSIGGRVRLARGEWPIAIETAPPSFVPWSTPIYETPFAASELPAHAACVDFLLDLPLFGLIVLPPVLFVLGRYGWGRAWPWLTIFAASVGLVGLAIRMFGPLTQTADWLSWTA